MKQPNNSSALNSDAVQPIDTQATPLDASLAPALPAYARLSEEQIAAARQAGQWLEAFVALASTASPLTPPYRRNNSGHKPVLARIV